MDLSKKNWGSSYQVRQTLALFSNLIALILGLKYVKSLLRVTKLGI